MKWFTFWALPDNPPKKPDCLIIPSYAVKSSVQLTHPTRAALDLAFRWWKQFPNAYLIMATGDNQVLGVPNSRVMANYTRQLGIPPRQIIEEDKSRNTYENLLYSREIVLNKHFHQPTLALFDLHARRALAIAKKLGWKNLYWVSAYSKGDPAYGYKYLQTYSRLTILIYEVLAIIYNKLHRQA